jgi:hypothetical protein
MLRRLHVGVAAGRQYSERPPKGSWLVPRPWRLFRDKRLSDDSNCSMLVRPPDGRVR